MNPAGFIFGKDAKTLDLPGSLTVTTANGIGFGSGSNINFFSATGSNDDYSKLTENPTAFAFTMDNPGAIVNSGDLSVKEGQNLTLIGGTVVNTGTLAAEKGQITIAAVPGKSTVRISQQGNLLSLDIASTTETTGNPNPLPSGFKIESLPNLLAGGNISNVTGITVNEDHTVTLTGSGINIKDGDVVSYNSGENSLAPVDVSDPIVQLNVSIISKNGNIKTDSIQAGDKVFLSAEKGNIEVDTIFAGILDNSNENFENENFENENFEQGRFRAGDIDIKAGGFFRAIGTETIDGANAVGGEDIKASITVANPASEKFTDENPDKNVTEGPLPFISIKTKNDATPTLINEPEPQIGDGRGRVKIEVGSEFFVVGDGIEETGSFKDNQSGTIGAIVARVKGDTTTGKFFDGREFGNPDPAPIENPDPNPPEMIGNPDPAPIENPDPNPPEMIGNPDPVPIENPDPNPPEMIGNPDPAPIENPETNPPDTIGNPDPAPIENPNTNSSDTNTADSNTGNPNTGNSNTGGTSIGNSNTGNSNTVDSNTGNSNTVDSNTGNSNTADSNTGNSNTSDLNTGNSNTGNSNTADSNTGNSNTSDSNTGNSNTADSNTGDSDTANSNTGDSDTANSNTGDSDIGNQEQQQQDRDEDRDLDQNQEQEEITVFGVLSLDESLVALLKDKGHASELTLTNDGNGELTGSDFNLFNTDDEEELKTFNFDRDLLYKNYVFSRK